MKQIQTVITVLHDGGQIVVRLTGIHVGPLAVLVDKQPIGGGMYPLSHDVRHETWDDGE